MMRPIRRQTGLALVLVIWILSLLTLMAGSFAMSMRRETSVSAGLKTQAQALALAETGIMLAQAWLCSTQAEGILPADGTAFDMPYNNGSIKLQVFAEAGKVDINTANENQLSALLRFFVEDDWARQGLLEAILDWRDPDDQARSMGAEKRQYRSAGLPYVPANAPFRHLEELQLVMGMNHGLFDALKFHITVHSGAAEVDKRLVSPALQAILAKGLERSNIQDTALMQRQPAVETLDGGCSDNAAYTIIADAVLPEQGSAGLEALVRYRQTEQGPRFTVLDWKQRQAVTEAADSNAPQHVD